MMQCFICEVSTLGGQIQLMLVQSRKTKNAGKNGHAPLAEDGLCTEAQEEESGAVKFCIKE